MHSEGQIRVRRNGPLFLSLWDLFQTLMFIFIDIEFVSNFHLFVPPLTPILSSVNIMMMMMLVGKNTDVKIGLLKSFFLLDQTKGLCLAGFTTLSE